MRVSDSSPRLQMVNLNTVSNFKDLHKAALAFLSFGETPAPKSWKFNSNDILHCFFGFTMLVQAYWIIQSLGYGSASAAVGGFLANLGEAARDAAELSTLRSITFEYELVGGSLATMITFGIGRVVLIRLQSRGSREVRLAEGSGG